MSIFAQSILLLLLFGAQAAAAEVALVIVDMQPHFIEELGTHDSPENLLKVNGVAARISTLIEAAKLNQRPIVVITYGPQDPSRPLIPTIEPLAMRLRGYNRFKEFVKYTDGAFKEDSGMRVELIDYLREEGVKDLVVTGANGEYCVHSTIQGALDLGYNVWAYTYGIISFASRNFEYPFGYRPEDLRPGEWATWATSFKVGPQSGRFVQGYDLSDFKNLLGTKK